MLNVKDAATNMQNQTCLRIIRESLCKMLLTLSYE